MRVFKRNISDFITYPIRHSPRDIEPNFNNGRLKVSLLKAPSHLGHFTSRMNRPYNEDKYSVNFINIPVLRNDYGLNKTVPQLCFVASIFDGHGGDLCSNFLQKKYNESIENTIPNDQSLVRILRNYQENIGGYWKRLFRKKDKFIERLHNKSKDEIDDLVPRITQASLELDYEFLLENPISGSTSTSVFIYNIDTRDNENFYYDSESISKIVVSQIGDTKCVICDKNGEAHALNAIHHPDSAVEAARLSNFNVGFITDSFGEHRFLNYENTRAFGDLRAKSRGITAEPDITSFIIGNAVQISREGLINKTIGKLGGDESFLVLMTDGVTNHASDQEVVDLVKATINNKIGSNAQDAAEEIIRYVEAVGGDDNATCLVVRLGGWGKWPMDDRTGAHREQRLRDGISRRT